MLKRDKEFLAFQREFTKYQKLFGLMSYKVYFKYEPLKECFAQIDCSQIDRVATVSLNSDLPDKDKPYRSTSLSAKHEACHLLINNLQACARSRYIREAEIYEACEEIVNRLENLIP